MIVNDSASPPPPGPRQDHDALARRLDLLERENDRLRRQIEDIVGPDNPCFDRGAFQRAMRFYMLALTVPLQFLIVPVMLLVPFLAGSLPRLPMIGPVPLLDWGGIGTSHPGLGFGIVALGGLSVGVVAVGGGAVGVVALGGGAIGLVAFGGGAVGLLALGGGSAGYIAIGGVALGRYALGQSAYGKAVFSARRQDPEAVRLFSRWLPRLKQAVTTPLPVIPLNRDENANAS